MTVVPLVHIEGTPSDELLQQQRDIKNACKVLYQALVDAAPEPRDYCPRGDEVALLAYQEHKQRLIDVARIKQDADRIIRAIHRQTGHKWWVDSPEETS